MRPAFKSFSSPSICFLKLVILGSLVFLILFKDCFTEFLSSNIFSLSFFIFSNCFLFTNISFLRFTSSFLKKDLMVIFFVFLILEILRDCSRSSCFNLLSKSINTFCFLFLLSSITELSSFFKLSVSSFLSIHFFSTCLIYTLALVIFFDISFSSASNKSILLIISNRFRDFKSSSFK